MILLGDAVNSRAVFALGGTHREPHLLAQGTTDEAADAVRLPGRGVHDLGERGALGPLDQGKDGSGLAALADAPSLRLRGFLGRFGGLFGRGRLLGLGCGGGLGFAALGAFLALGRALLGAGPLLRGGFLRRNVRALCRNVGGAVSVLVLVVSAFWVVIFV